MGKRSSELTDKTRGADQDLFKNDLELFINDIKTKQPKRGYGILSINIGDQDINLEIENLDELKTLLNIE